MIDLFISNVDQLVLSFVQGTFGNVGSAIAILWRLMFIIFIAVFGYKVMISGRFSASDLIVNCLKITVILTIATEWPTFFIFVYEMVTDMPSDIAGLLVSAASDITGSTTTDALTANQALSAFHDRAMVVTDRLLEGAGFTNWSLYLYALIVWISAMAFTAYAAMLIVLAKLAVAILLAVGPLFILLLIFGQTRSLFEGWLRTVLNYALIPVFVYALLALILVLAESPLAALEAHSAPNSELLSYIAPFMFTGIVASLLLAQIMNIASSVTGGLSLSSMGTALWSARTTRSLGRHAPRFLARTPVYMRGMVSQPLKGINATKTRMSSALKNTRGL